jgi:hypothetical protein
MSDVDTAIQRLQALSLQASTDLKNAPSFPVDDAAVLPLSIAHLAGGTASADDATSTREIYRINVDFHFSRVSLRNAYTQIDATAPAFNRILAGDPTLGGAVDTIVFPVEYSVSPAMWDRVVTQMLSYTIPVKIRKTPSTSS